MLESQRWSHLAPVLDEKERAHLNLVWHRLKGKGILTIENGVLNRFEGWPDATMGLYALKKHVIIASLSNGNMRLLVDMASCLNLSTLGLNIVINFTGEVWGLSVGCCLLRCTLQLV